MNLHDQVRAAIKARWKTVRACALEIGVDESWLGDVLRGRYDEMKISLLLTLSQHGLKFQIVDGQVAIVASGGGEGGESSGDVAAAYTTAELLRIILHRVEGDDPPATGRAWVG